MAVITRVIPPGEQSADVTEMQKALLKLGAVIASNERFTGSSAGIFGPTTQTAVAALYQRFGMTSSQPTLFNAAIGRLLHIAAAAEAGESAALHQAVREAFAARAATPAAAPIELAWMARYAAIARDFTTARAALNLIPASAPENVLQAKETIASVAGSSTLQPTEPELLNPENYYTVRYDYVPRTTINTLMGRP